MKYSKTAMRDQIDHIIGDMMVGAPLIKDIPDPYRSLLSAAYEHLDVTLEELNVFHDELERQDSLVTARTFHFSAGEPLFARLFELSTFGYLVTDTVGGILEFNRAAAVMLNVEPRFLEKKPLISFISQEERRVLRYVMQKAVANSSPLQFECQLQPRHQENVTVLLTMASAPQPEGMAKYIHWIIEDITHARQLEEEVESLVSQVEDRVQARTASLATALEREHDIAEVLQRSILRDVSRTVVQGLRIESIYEPAVNDLLVGGDFFDVCDTQDLGVALVVGDVSGKGLEAASRTAEIKYALRGILYASDSGDEIINTLNAYLYESYRSSASLYEGFVALALVLVDPSERTLSVICAGIEGPFLLRANGSIEQIGSRNVPLGLFPDSNYRLKSYAVEPGDKIVMMTDGITEARGGGGDFLNESAMYLILEDAASITDLPSATTHILHEAKRFAHGNLHDDVCILAAQF